MWLEIVCKWWYLFLFSKYNNTGAFAFNDKCHDPKIKAYKIFAQKILGWKMVMQLIIYGIFLISFGLVKLSEKAGEIKDVITLCTK